MNFKTVVICALKLTLLGCGVKGDPLPPDIPVSVGRGRPTFQKAVRDVKPVPVKVKEEDDDEKKQ